MLREFIQRVSSGKVLSRTEAHTAMEQMLSGEANDVQIAGLLVALHTRGETAGELAALLEIMREKMTVVTDVDPHAVDVCGTGGDHSMSFNLSTAAALVAAAGGITVAKHGNRAVSSTCGSADFVEALGLRVATDAESAGVELRNRNFAFLFAPHFHPAARAVASARKQLGVRTVFNLLGPLANPARVTRQMVGVFSPVWIEPIAETLASTGSEHVMIVHGAGGLDEVSAEGKTDVLEINAGARRRFTLSPEEIGVNPTRAAWIAGTSAADNARRFVRLAGGSEPELAEWVIANAASAFYLSGQAQTLRDGAAQARQTIETGRLREFLRTLGTESAK